MKNLIVIAIYDESKYLPICIRSIIENTNLDYKISIINTKNPRISLAKAWNTVIEENEDYDIITVLNDDIIIGKNCLEYLNNELLKSNDVGLVSPSTSFCGNAYQTTPFRIFATKDIESHMLEDVNVLSGKIKERYNGRVHQCDNSISGSCMSFRRSTWEEMGKFDENFFPAYGEDNDFEDRMMARGYKLFWVLYAFVLHYGAKTAIRVPDLNRKFTTNLYYEKLKELNNKEK